MGEGVGEDVPLALASGRRYAREIGMGILAGALNQGGEWAETRWSVVSSLGRRDDPDWNASWVYLVETYRPAMERYVRTVLSRARGRPASIEEAEELVQGFLAVCVEKEWLAQATATRGRFRAYVRTLLQRYVYKRLRHAGARKRRPPDGMTTYGLFEHDAVHHATPEEDAELAEFDRGWVSVAVDRALQRLALDHVRYQVIIADLLSTDGEGSPDIGELVGAEPKQLAVLRHRARKRFRALFEEELRATVGDRAAFEEEWRALQPYLP